MSGWPEEDRGLEKIGFRLAKPEGTALATAFKTHEGDGMYTQGTFISVPADRILEALEIGRKEGLKIAKVKYFFESYYFECSP